MLFVLKMHCNGWPAAAGQDLLSFMVEFHNHVLKRGTDSSLTFPTWPGCRLVIPRKYLYSIPNNLHFRNPDSQ